MRLVVLFLILTLLVVPTPCSPRDVGDELANRIDRIMQSRSVQELDLLENLRSA